jgi:hypothetical protein
MVISSGRDADSNVDPSWPPDPRAYLKVTRHPHLDRTSVLGNYRDGGEVTS